MTQIPFGVKDGIMVDIHQVDKGLACGCQCAHCLSSLIARKGKINVHHFAHKPGAVCQNSYETSIHKMAKQILMNEKHLKLPGLQITVKDKTERGIEYTKTEWVCESQWISFDEVKEEVTLGNIRADIVGYKNKYPLIIEIMVTHASGQNKKRYIRNQAWAAIEINLTELGYQADTEILKENILDSITNKYWLSHPRVPKIKQSLKQKLKGIISKENKKDEFDVKESIRKQKKIAQYHARRYEQIKYSFKNPTREVSPHEYATRFFICDTCSHQFNIKQNELNELGSELYCPKCKEKVNQLAK